MTDQATEDNINFGEILLTETPDQEDDVSFAQRLASDPDIARQIAAEAKARFSGQTQQASPYQQTLNSIEQIENEMQAFIDSTEANKDYSKYEKLRIQKDKLERQLRLMERQEQQDQQRRVTGKQEAERLIRQFLSSKISELDSDYGIRTKADVKRFGEEFVQILRRDWQPSVWTDPKQLPAALKLVYAEAIKERARKKRNPSQQPTNQFGADDMPDEEPAHDLSDEEVQGYRMLGIPVPGEKRPEVRHEPRRVKGGKEGTYTWELDINELYKAGSA